MTRKTVEMVAESTGPADPRPTPGVNERFALNRWYLIVLS